MEQEIKQAEIRERITLPFGKKRMEIVIADDCEFVNEDGKLFVVRKQPQYPKDIDGCLKVLGLTEESVCYTTGYKNDLLMRVQLLLICRDAYWKIAGDWKPDWTDGDAEKYSLVSSYGEIVAKLNYGYSQILCFPTEEMRDAFYENFKDLINEVKELL